MKNKNRFIDISEWDEEDQYQHFLFVEELCDMIKWCRNGDIMLFREFVEEAIEIMNKKSGRKNI